MSYYFGVQQVTQNEYKAICKCEDWWKNNQSRIAKMSVEWQISLLRQLVKGCDKVIDKFRRIRGSKQVNSVNRKCFDRDGRTKDAWGEVIREARLKNLLGPFYGPLDIKEHYSSHEPVGEIGSRWICPIETFTAITGIKVPYDTPLDRAFVDLHIACDTESLSSAGVVHRLKEVKYLLERLIYEIRG